MPLYSRTISLGLFTLAHMFASNAVAQPPPAPVAPAPVAPAPVAPVPEAAPPASQSVADTARAQTTPAAAERLDAPQPTTPPESVIVGPSAELDSGRARRDADDPALPEAERVARHPWMVLAGGRSMLVSDAAFDAFSESDALSQFSLGFGRSLYARDRLSVAALAFWDVGERSSTARGEPTRLMVHRLAVGPELRLHPLRDLYAYARVAPALIHSEAKLEETTTGATLYSRSDDLDLDFLGQWDFGIDSTAGVAYEVIGTAGRHAGWARFWVVAEGGYAWATRGDLRLAPDSDDSAAPERVESLDQGTLALRGPMFRLMLAASF